MQQIEHKRYKKPGPNSDYFFFISSSSLADDLSFIEQHKIENVGLSQYEDYTFTNILPVLHLKSIRKLRVFVKKIDLTGLGKLASLEELSIGEEYKKLDFTGLTMLKHLYITGGKFTGLTELGSLKDLSIVYGNPATLSTENFSENSSIESLGSDISGLVNDV